MRCRQVRHWLVEFATDGIDPAREDAFLAHLAACDGCAAEWAELEQVTALLPALDGPPPSPLRLAAIVDQVEAQLDSLAVAPARSPRFSVSGRLATAGALACLLLGVGFGLGIKARHDSISPTLALPEPAAERIAVAADPTPPEPEPSAAPPVPEPPASTAPQAEIAPSASTPPPAPAAAPSSAPVASTAASPPGRARRRVSRARPAAARRVVARAAAPATSVAAAAPPVTVAAAPLPPPPAAAMPAPGRSASSPAVFEFPLDPAAEPSPRPEPTVSRLALTFTSARVVEVSAASFSLHRVDETLAVDRPTAVPDRELAAAAGGGQAAKPTDGMARTPLDLPVRPAVMAVERVAVTATEPLDGGSR